MSSAVFRRRTRSQIKCFLHRKVIVKKTYCLGTLLLSVLMAAPLVLQASQSYYPVKLDDPAAVYLTKDNFPVHADGVTDTDRRRAEIAVTP